MMQMIGLALAGLWTGWGVLIIRDDLKIRKDHKWRKARAAFLALVLAMFMLSLGARGVDKLSIFTASACFAIGLMLPQKRVMPRRKKKKR